ncbi:roadblock/LC7 domain-containing protein [Nocardiopsis halotolerans]|uniref:roadblock/LC7 domain-containing protein n=1 Tax=Nocardiopsis halotolerans TaxID=124252 RepID=UPI00034AA451|nr:roadblock/LC7 domain-containing protein [Nocardiopsis halotolerans]
MRFDQQLREMLQTPGVVSVCLVDWRDGRTLAHVGADDRPLDAAAILGAIHGGPLCASQRLEDVVVTDADHHLLFAPVEGSDLCVRVRMGRAEGSLGFTLRRLRVLVCTVRVPPPGDDADGPPRRGRPRPVARVAAPVDRGVLERVLTALRTLAVGRFRSAAA